MLKASPINRRQTQIYQLGFDAPFRKSGGRAFIRLLNWYTGVGKTYTAASFALHLFLTERVVPVFLAPLQSVVTGFAGELRGHMRIDRFHDEIEEAVRNHGAMIPIYRLYSCEYHFNDRSFFHAYLLLDTWLHQQPVIRAALEDDLSNNKRLGGTRSSLDSQLSETRSKCNVCLKSELHSLLPSSEDYETEKIRYEQAARKVLSMANRITRKIIDLEVRSRYLGPANKFMSAPEVYEMVRRLFPLQAFAEKPGLIIGTAAKATKSLQVLLYHEDDDCCKWINYDSVFLFARDLNRMGNPLARVIARQQQRMRVIAFIDEEEDSYWYLFDQRRSIVNPQGRNDLNEVIGDFHKFFDLKWPFAFERGRNCDLARKIFDNLWAFADVSFEAEQMFNNERVTTGTAFIALDRQIALLRQVLSGKWPDVSVLFSNEELLEVYQKLIATNDAHAGFQRFRQKALVLSKVRAFVNDLPRDARKDPYSAFRRLRDLIFDKKFFLISRSSYGEMLDQPSQTFFNAAGNVMTSDYLSRVQLLPDTGDQTIRLEYHERGVKNGAFTLLHYVKFLVLIADILNDKNVDDSVRFNKDDEDRYSNLCRFAADIRQLFKSRNHKDGLTDGVLATEAVGDSFFFSGTKSIVCLDESHRQPIEYNTTQDMALSLSIVSLRDTPEEDLRNLLGENNGIYLLSATGGLQPCSSGTFNQRRLQEMLSETGGNYFPMTKDELDVVAALAEQQRSKRQRVVGVVDNSLLAYRFPASHSYAGLLSKFIGALPLQGPHRHDRMSPYKEQEVRGLVSSLDRLLSTPLRSGMCLCLSMKWARTCLMGLARMSTFVKQIDHGGHHFVVDPMMLPQYHPGGVHERIHIVLYAAGQFRRHDPSLAGLGQETEDYGQFSNEFLEALDVTDKKVLLWTAYRSAARGTNFVVTRNGRELDFQLIYLINSPFYTRHTWPGTHGFHIESFQSLIQVLNDRPGGAQMMSRSDLLYEHARHRCEILSYEHFIDLCRTLFQALGRVERRPENLIERQEIYLDAEVAKIIHLGTRYAPELVHRASATQIAVLKMIADYNQHTELFHDEEERHQHALQSMRRARIFRKFTKTLPSHFRSSEKARLEWESMFDERMITDPRAYIAHLGSRGIPADYCDALYLRVPHWAVLYSRTMNNLGNQQPMITDHADGVTSYEWVASIAPAGLLRQLSSPVRKLHKFAKGFPDNSANGEFFLVPQPWFVANIIKGYIAEREFIRLAHRELGLDLQTGNSAGRFKLVEVLNHSRVADIYQKFDFYIELDGKVLLAIDIKNWTRATDALKKTELEYQAKLKQRQLASLFPEFTVHALYVNLCGTYKHTFERQPASGAITFMSMYVRGSSSSRAPWIPNANLALAMLWSGK